ncbi:MAG: hypothetical protein K1X64_01810 [Myxococcaceae bacterium]|nr:hypothetical protein [Myxococcaceae bacterium]
MSKRPHFNQAVNVLLKHVVRTVPEFAHLKPARILVVAGEARRASRATVKPLLFTGGRRTDPGGRKKPVVKIQGKRVLYAITLRPLFFRKSTVRARIATILHELFHISHAFDGTLDHRRRHAESGEQFEKAFRPIERRYWRSIPAEVVAPFAFDGEVRVLQWLERPESWLPGERASIRHLYTEKQLFEGIVRMKTPRTRARVVLPPAPSIH